MCSPFSCVILIALESSEVSRSVSLEHDGSGIRVIGGLDGEVGVEHEVGYFAGEYAYVMHEAGHRLVTDDLPCSLSYR